MALAWQRTDDFDGTAAEEVTFGLNGKTYTLDLSAGNKKKLQQILQPYLTVAREYGEMPPAPQPEGKPAASAPKRVTVRRRAVSDPPAVKRNGKANGKMTAVPHSTIRSWANQNGYAVTPKGRIPDAVITAYEEATAGKK